MIKIKLYLLSIFILTHLALAEDRGVLKELQSNYNEYRQNQEETSARLRNHVEKPRTFYTNGKPDEEFMKESRRSWAVIDELNNRVDKRDERLVNSLLSSDDPKAHAAANKLMREFNEISREGAKTRRAITEKERADQAIADSMVIEGLKKSASLEAKIKNHRMQEWDKKIESVQKGVEKDGTRRPTESYYPRKRDFSTGGKSYTGR